MKIKIGLVTRNSELADDLKINIPEYEVITYKNIDNLSKEETDIFIIDYDEIGSPDSTQFFLSRLRKKIHDIPVFLYSALIQFPNWMKPGFLMILYFTLSVKVNLKPV